MKKAIKYASVAIFTAAVLIGCKYKIHTTQTEINTKFRDDYTNLTLGMLNRSIQTDEHAIHSYDIANTKYAFRLAELYPKNTYIKNQKFNDIIMLLDQASGCDAIYGIAMDKELYDKLNILGTAIFSKPQSYTDEMLEETYTALENAVDFNMQGGI